MRVPSLRVADAALILQLSLLLAPLPTEAMFRCNQIVADKQKFDLSALGGPHSVVVSHVIGDAAHNTTYTVDICRPLKKKGDVKKDEQCTNGAQGMLLTLLLFLFSPFSGLGSIICSHASVF